MCIQDNRSVPLPHIRNPHPPPLVFGCSKRIVHKIYKDHPHRRTSIMVLCYLHHSLSVSRISAILQWRGSSPFILLLENPKYLLLHSNVVLALWLLLLLCARKVFLHRTGAAINNNILGDSHFYQAKGAGCIILYPGFGNYRLF